jgi:hypothetical protein
MWRFGIRDVLWLLLAVGLGLGWWLDHRKQETRIAATSRELRQASKAFQEVVHLLGLYGMDLTKTEENGLGKVSIVLTSGKFSLDGVDEIKRAWRVDDEGQAISIRKHAK